MHYLKRSLYILICLYVISLLMYYAFEKGYKYYFVDKTKRMTELFEKSTDYDVIFIGSSRVHLHVNPKIFDSITHLRSYNAGMEGANISEYKMVLDAYLVNHPSPKYIVLNIEPVSLNMDRILFHPSDYFPYFSNKQIECSFSNYGYPVFLYNCFPQLKFTGFDDYDKGNSIKGLLKKHESTNEYSYQGFLSNGMDTIIDAKPEIASTGILSIAENSFSILQEMIDTCRHKNIKLIFTHSAEYMQINEKKYSNYESLMDSLLTISKANNIVYLRHDTIGMCTQKKYFKNVGHLNKSGADTYTKVLADDFLLKRN